MKYQVVSHLVDIGRFGWLGCSISCTGSLRSDRRGLRGLSLELGLDWSLGGAEAGVGTAVKTTEIVPRTVPVQLAHRPAGRHGVPAGGHRGHHRHLRTLRQAAHFKS